MTKYRLIDNTDAEDLEAPEEFTVGEPAGLATRQPSGASTSSDSVDPETRAQLQQHRLTTINVTTVLEDTWFEVVHNTASISGFYKFALAAIGGLLNPNLSLMAEEFQFDARERDTKLAAYLTLAFFLSGVPAAAAAGLLSDVYFGYRRLFMALATAVAELCCVLVWFLPVGPVAYYPLLVLRALAGAMVRI